MTVKESGYATIAATLRTLRDRAGRPSYTEIARRVGKVRAERGAPEAERTPPRVTVYDLFKPDRRRFDVDLVVDIGRALGVADADADEWARTCWAARLELDAARIVEVHAGAPAPTPGFVGRHAELAALAHVEAAPRVLVHAMAGSGKTELVRAAAAALVARGRVSTVISADLRGFDAERPPAEPAALLHEIARALGGDPYRLPTDEVARRRAVDDLLVERHALLLLDDARSAEQVTPLLPLDAHVPVLVTSRVAFADQIGLAGMALGPLDRDAAVEMLARHVAGDRTALDALADAAGRLPLALAVLAARMAARPTWTADDHLDGLMGWHGELRLDDAVAAVLAQSARAVSPPAFRALRLVAAQPVDDVSTDSFAAIAGIDPPTARQLADELVAASMMERRPSGRLGLHDVVRAFARERSLDEDRPVDRTVALAALLDHLVAMARAAQRAVAPHRVFPARTEVTAAVGELTEDEATAWVDDEFDTLLAVTTDRCGEVRPTIAVELSEALMWYVGRHLRFREAVILYERAAEAARDTGDRPGEGVAEMHLGQCHLRLGDRSAGLEALRRAERLLGADTRTTWWVHNALAVAAFESADWATARSRLEAAINAVSAVDEPSDAGRLAGNLAVLLCRLGDHDAAAERNAVAIELARSIRDHDSLASVLATQSAIRHSQERFDEALAAADEALELCARHDIPAVVAIARTSAGLALCSLGRTDEAIAAHREALADARENDPVTEATVLNNLAEAHLTGGDAVEAAAGFDAALDTATEAGDDFERGRALDGLARLALARGARAEARRRWSSALLAFGDGVPEASMVRTALAELDAA